MTGKVFSIRLNEKECRFLSDKANAMNMKLSTYLKSIATHEAIGKRCSKKADAKLVMQLSNIACTLNFMMLILDTNTNQQTCELLHQDFCNMFAELKRIGDRYDC